MVSIRPKKNAQRVAAPETKETKKPKDKKQKACKTDKAKK